MRVITGAARGRRLKELEGYETRPTTDRVKEGVFNIIQFDIEGRKVLDLFAGTGQLGIEALSRGVEARAAVLCADALTYPAAAREKFDLIFIDPPYAANLWEKMLDSIYQFDILSNHGIIVCESPAEQNMPPLAPPYFLHRTYRYGKTKITTYHREETSE